MAIIVSPLRLFHTMIEARTPDRIVSLLSPTTEFPSRAGFEDRHLKIAVHDIVDEAAGFEAPQKRHVESIIAFVSAWDRTQPLFVHCFAGISRSTATAFIAAAIHNPDTPETVIAAALRAASPSASPNARIMRLADDLLGRGGCLAAAAGGLNDTAIEAEEARPFEIPAHFPRS